MKMWWLVFVVMTIICWGCYVPTIHKGQGYLGGPKPTGGLDYSGGGLRAFFMVGLAYCATAVVMPLILFAAGWEPMKFFGEGTATKGTTIAFFAGVLGAIGALGIILAIKSGGVPIIVAPLVFAGAPVVNVLVSMAMNPPASAPKPLFFVGIVMAAVGAGLALYAKPPEKKPVAAKPATTTVEPAAEKTAEKPAEKKDAENAKPAGEKSDAAPADTAPASS